MIIEMPWTKISSDNIKIEQNTDKKDSKRTLSYREAIKEAQAQALEKDPRVFIMGEGVDDPGGVFGTTLNLHKKYGKERIIDLPLSENGFTGIAIGAAMAGMRPILVHMRMDFLLLSMDQIINHAAKWRYMFGGRQSIPLVIRCIIGRGWGSAAQHSQSLQGLFLHVPGLKLLMPSNAYDVKGLFLTALNDNDPVIFIEHRWLYEQIDTVPQEMYTIPLGVGSVKKLGNDVTVVTVSYMLYEVLKASEILLKEDGVNIEIIDLRSINPMDENIILKSLKKTGRLLIADTGWKTCGISSEIAARVVEKAFSYLKAPVVRVALPDTHTPASPVLEKAFYPNTKDIVSGVRKLLKS